MLFKREFWFGIIAGLVAGSFLRYQKQTGLTQDRLDQYYKMRAGNYDATDIIFPRVTMRKTLMDMLNLKPGDTVMDFACGTGLNFPFIMERIGPTGKLVGVDYSQEMLDVAQQQINAHGWKNVELVQADAAEMHFDQQFDAVMVTLGLAVIPRYEMAMQRAMEAVKPGGLFGTADIKESERWYTQPIRFLTDLMDVFIIADSSRRPWEMMPAMGEDFRYQEIFHGYFYSATVRKPLDVKEIA